MKFAQCRHLIFVIFLFFSCNGDSFYSTYKVEDVWRLPLVKPYELRNSLDPSEESYKGRGWSIRFSHAIKSANGLEENQINVSKVNVQDSIIFGYGLANPGYPFIIDTKSNKEMIFEKKEDWSKKLDSLNIESDSVSDIQPLFEHFKNEQTLPWYRK